MKITIEAIQNGPGSAELKATYAFGQYTGGTKETGNLVTLETALFEEINAGVSRALKKYERLTGEKTSLAGEAKIGL